MENIENIKQVFLFVTGMIGGTIANLLGGWDAALAFLIGAMAIDYVSGLIVAGVFKASPKTANGVLESGAGWKGLCRKGMTLLIVFLACQLDIVMGTNFVRDAVIIAYIANECISIIENAGLMGVPVPAALKKAVEVLQGKNKGVER